MEQKLPDKIPEGSVVREDGCICPAEEKKKTYKCGSKPVTCPHDPRFPNQNQTKHCYISFIDYQRCTRLLGDYPGCYLFYQCYRALCPEEWTERWYDQMEKGIFPRKIYPPKPIIRPKKGEVPCVELEEGGEQEGEKSVC